MESFRKFLASALLAAFVVSAFASTAEAAVRVRGYYRKDGTYVQPHYRSNPDGNPYNNWSFPGNVNPYTGKVAPGNPDTYLRNYYNRSGGGISIPSYSPPSYSPPPSTLNQGAAVGGVVIGGTIFNGFLTCTRGHKKNYSTNSCEPVIVPPNARLDYFGTGWICNQGYKRLGESCVQIQIPANASPDYWGDFTCNRGYVRNYATDQCDLVRVPPNAALNYWGTNFECLNGYARNYNTNTCDSIITNGPPEGALNAFRIRYQVQNYYDSNRTCIGLTGNDYRDCIFYAFNQDKNWIGY